MTVMTLAEAPSKIYQTAITSLPTVLSGDGIYVTVKDPVTGEIKKMIDANSGAAVCAVGHCDPEIREKMKEAVDKHIYNFPLFMTNNPSEELAEFIISHCPKDTFESAIFVGSGSEANENGLKIVRKYFLLKGETKRIKFISRTQSYHGFTIGAMSIGHNNRAAEFEGMLMNPEITPKVSHVYPYRNQKDGETLEEYKDRLLAEIEDTFIREGPETIAAFICETVTGSSFGCQTPVPGYLDGVRDICHKYGAIFYLDEVMCGFGRCGSFNAWEQFMDGPGPDIQVNGKTLGSGFVTIASILFSPKIMKVFKDNKTLVPGAQTYHSHGFNCQVALEVQKKVFRDDLITNIYNNGNYMGNLLAKKLKDNQLIGEVRGAGGFWGVEFVKDKTTKEPFPQSVGFAARFGKACYNNGMFVQAAPGTINSLLNLGDHVLLGPAFTITKEQVETVAEIFEKSLKDVEVALVKEGLL